MLLPWSQLGFENANVERELEQRVVANAHASLILEWLRKSSFIYLGVFSNRLETTLAFNYLEKSIQEPAVFGDRAELGLRLSGNFVHENTRKYKMSPTQYDPRNRRYAKNVNNTSAYHRQDLRFTDAYHWIYLRVRYYHETITSG